MGKDKKRVLLKLSSYDLIGGSTQKVVKNFFFILASRLSPVFSSIPLVL